MTNPLDMCDTIAFYENTPEVDKKLDVILGQTFGFYVPKVRSLCLAESEHYQFSFAQMRKIVDKLPKNAQKYLIKIAELVNAEIGIVSVGPNRRQTFYA